MVVAAGSKSAKFNLRRGSDSAHLVVSDNSNGDISRTSSGCFSSIAEVHRDPYFVACTTFNILAPIYKRLDQHNQGLRESDFRSFWLSRNHRILDWLIHESSSIMCLQEFWVGNDELVHMYEERLGSAGYHLFKLAQTNSRGDGLPNIAICGIVSKRKQVTGMEASEGMFISSLGRKKARKALKKSWAEAVFSIIKYQLRKVSLSEDDAFAFMKGDNCDDFLTYSSFSEALRQQKIWNSTEDLEGSMDDASVEHDREAIGFEVKNAMLFPREVEKGFWPEDYSLSYHARLTLFFSPARESRSVSQKCHS